MTEPELKILRRSALTSEPLRVKQERAEQEAAVATLEKQKADKKQAAFYKRVYRNDAIGHFARRGRDDYADGPGLYLAEDEDGSIRAKNSIKGDMYYYFNPWHPLHAFAWIRTAITGKVVWVEDD